MTWSPIADAAPTIVVSAALSTPRLMVFMAIVPLFPSVVFTRLLRVGITLGLGAPVAMGLFHQLSQQRPHDHLVAIVLKECILGLLLGLAVAAPLWAISAVGALADNQRGANAAQQLTPFGQADASVLGSALQQALVVLLAASGGFAAIYQLLLSSFEAWPVLQLVPDVARFALDLSAARFSEFLEHAVLYAAPVLAIVLLVDFAFALAGVFAPQLQTYFAAMPVKSIAAVAVLAVYVFVLLSHSEGYFHDVLHRETVLLKSLSP